jgi:hypothetical protein
VLSEFGCGIGLILPIWSPVEMKLDRQNTLNGYVLFFPTSDAIDRYDTLGQQADNQAQDLINVMILAPQVKAHLGIHIKTGSNKHTVPLHSGQANTFTVPFTPGPVTFEITADRQGVREVVLGGSGREIMAQTEKYNFNMWTGSWRAKFEDPK